MCCCPFVCRGTSVRDRSLARSPARARARSPFSVCVCVCARVLRIYAYTRACIRGLFLSPSLSLCSVSPSVKSRSCIGARHRRTKDQRTASPRPSSFPLTRLRSASRRASSRWKKNRERRPIVRSVCQTPRRILTTTSRCRACRRYFRSIRGYFRGGPSNGCQFFFSLFFVHTRRYATRVERDIYVGSAKSINRDGCLPCV